MPIRILREDAISIFQETELPTDRLRRFGHDVHAETYNFVLSEELSEGARRLSQQYGVTLTTTLLAAFQVLIARYSGHDAGAAASPEIDPVQQESADLIGVVASTLILRYRLEGNPAFCEFLQRVHHWVLQANEYDGKSLEEAKNLLYLAHTSNVTPVVRVLFANGGQAHERNHAGVIQPDLSLILEDQRRHIAGRTEFNKELFEPATVREMTQCYMQLLKSTVRDPSCRVWQLEMLSETERQTIVYGWNQTEAGYILQGTILDLVEATTAENGEAIAIAAGGDNLSYRDLNARANQMAHYLLQRGIGAGSIVGVCTERSPSMVICMLALWKIGAAYLPLDATYPADRIVFSLKESKSAMVLTQHSLLGLFSEEPIAVLCIDNYELFQEAPRSNLGIRPRQSDCAYVIYTSGSAGTPKGVMISHRSLLNLALWHQQTYAVSKRDRASQIASPGFDACVWEIWPYLASGSTVVIVEEEVKLAPSKLQQWLVQKRITLAFVPTPLAELLLDEPWPNAISLRAMLVGGDRLTRRPNRSIHFPVINHYGPTEATVVTTAGPVAATDEEDKLPDIGKPISNCRVYILNSHLGPVPAGVAGEICIGGEGVAIGYVPGPHGDHSCFINNPFGKGKLYKTGDIARYRRDGRIQFIGRRDQQVKIQGYRIELGEIKSVLESCADVSQAAVVIERGDSGPQIVAYCVMRAESDFQTRDLRTILKRKLPHYMTPSIIVELPSLPISANGKVDLARLVGLRKTIRGKLRTRARSTTEMSLMRIWSELFSTNELGIHDEFLELGGNSLLAAQLKSRIEKNWGVHLRLQTIFDCSTIAELARTIDSGKLESLAEASLIQRRPRRQYHVSFAQIRLWLLYKLNPHNPAYNLCDVCRLRGRLDVGALERALYELMHRHETLRTTFREENGEPLQCVAQEINVPLAQVDATMWLEQEREAQISALLQEQSQRAFDLETGPLFRCLLIRVSEFEHVLALMVHHIVFDGWSRALLFSEFVFLYQALARGDAQATLPNLEIQYGDFAEWQRQSLNTTELARLATYWQEELAGAPEILALPTDRPRKALVHGRTGMYRFECEEEVLNGLRKIGREQGATLFMTLLAVFQILMARYSGQDDLCVGSAVAGRNLLETEKLIGFFINTLILRAKLTGNPQFHIFLENVRATVLGAFNHQEMPFDQLVCLLQPERSATATPYVQVIFALQNFPRVWADDTGLISDPVGLPSTSPKFDLSVLLEERDGKITGNVEFDAGLFDLATIATMMNCYGQLLKNAIAKTDSPVYQLKMLTDEGRMAVLEAGSTADPAYKLSTEVVSLIEQAVINHKRKLAIAGSGGQLSYDALNCHANRLAHWLRGQGIGPGSVVAICTERCPAMIVCMTGILKSGAAYLPLDPIHPPARLQTCIRESGTVAVLTQAHLQHLWSDTPTKVILVDNWNFLLGMPETNLGTKPQQSDCAYIIYTSGSTGTPKGVMVNHRSLLNLVLWHQYTYGVSSEDRASQIASPGFDAAVWEIWPYLAAGSCIFIVEEHLKLEPDKLRQWLAGQQITITFLPTPLGESLLELRWSGKTALRALLVGGDRLTRRPDESFGVPVFNHYGPTEGTVVATAGRVATDDEYGRLPDIGRPIWNCYIYILDRFMEPVPWGVVGEIYLGGEGVAIGYQQAPDHEPSAFLDDPFQPGRLYRTGDLARFLKNGNIEFVGRADEQAKVRGYRIDLAEIKSALDEVPEVTDSAVIVEQVNNVSILAAYLVSSESSNLKMDMIHDVLIHKLPRYMLPSSYYLVPMIPTTANGKVDRKRLARCTRTAVPRNYVRPQSETEVALAEVWSQILGSGQIGRHDNFFDNGGNSLLAIELQGLSAKRGLHFSVRDIFHYQTVAELAQITNIADWRTEPSSAVDCSSDPIPLLPLQRSFFEMNILSATRWNVSMLFRILKPVKPELLRLAIEEAVNRHEAFQMQFRQVAGQWMQYHSKEGDWEMFQSFNLADLGDKEQVGELERRSFNTHASMAFGKGRLVRFAFFDLGKNGCRLLIVAHHLIADALSLRVLCEDLAVFYNGLCGSTAASRIQQLPPSSGIIAWARRVNSPAAVSDALRSQSEWIPKETAALPLDFVGGKNLASSTAAVHVELDRKESSALCQLAQSRYRANVDVLLLAAAATAVGVWQERESVTLNFLDHGRETKWRDLDLSRTVGWLTIHYPLTLGISLSDGLSGAILAVTKELDRLKVSGIDYGILKHIYNHKTQNAPLPLAPEADWAFDYIGNLDTMFSQNDLLQMAEEKLGDSRDPDSLNVYRLIVVCYIKEGKISSDWIFSSNLHKKETIERLGVAFCSSLRQTF